MFNEGPEAASVARNQLPNLANGRAERSASPFMLRSQATTHPISLHKHKRRAASALFSAHAETRNKFDTHAKIIQTDYPPTLASNSFITRSLASAQHQGNQSPGCSSLIPRKQVPVETEPLAIGLKPGHGHLWCPDA